MHREHLASSQNKAQYSPQSKSLQVFITVMIAIVAICSYIFSRALMAKKLFFPQTRPGKLQSARQWLPHQHRVGR